MKETGQAYWRSLNQLHGAPGFEDWLHREFPEGASELKDSASRRTLLRLMAASFGLAGLTACRRPVEKILPAAKGVEEMIPGSPLYYATAMTMGGEGAAGLVVETHDGRPTKIEGNPKHPLSGGAAGAFVQAAVLGLYDPDRTKHVFHNGRRAGWDEFSAFAREQFANDGAGLRFLSEPVVSPSLEAVRRHALARFPQAKWVEWEPLNADERLAGAEMAFGRAVETHYHFDKADVVVSLDADFLGLDARSVTWIRDFSRRRKVAAAEAMNRLYAIESQFSLTGAMADHRKRMRGGETARFAVSLAWRLSGQGLNVLDGDKWVRALAADLNAHKGRSIVLAGPRQPAVVHAAAHLLNEVLGNNGQTVTYTQPLVERPLLAGWKELAADIDAGRVRTLVVLGGNPAFTAPADAQPDLKKVQTVVRLGLEDDETAAAAAWRLPEAHFLESWGDTRASDGTVSIQQPMIQALYEGKTAAEVVALISGYKDQRAYDIVRNSSGLQEAAWRAALHDGVVPGTKFAEVRPVCGLKAAQLKAPGDGGGIEIGFYPSASVWDGRYANNGWLQEAPDPMTKLTWDNAALMSPATAKSLGIADGDLVVLSGGGREATIPALVQPGHADAAVSVAVGYGRSRCGRVGRGVGHNVYGIRTSGGLGFAAGFSVRKTGRRYPLATTQEHHSMEGRPLAREAALAEFQEGHGKAHGHELFSLYKEHSYDKGSQWGMAIDLSACIGCNACLVACQAENNIPIVGKEQVARGREMHWIRLDRYFTGSEEDPRAVTQPVACQQCENAPCESVCPVAATSHSPEGLNDMAYNRCIGTRYCANNCPYKVRRFNFLDWHKDLAESEKMAYNPDVSVRMRGVMEKCTYCVQRIQETRIRAKAEGRRAIRDGEVVPACAQTCPAEAIVFGNLNDPASRVSKAAHNSRNYAMLAELNVKPRTTYLARLRNPNPELQHG